MSNSNETHAPLLHTERLILSGHSLADLPDSETMWTDGEVMRLIGGRPSTPNEVWQRLLRYAGHWQLLGFGYWVAREKASGCFVGEVGFGHWRRGLKAGLEAAPELGYALKPSFSDAAWRPRLSVQPLPSIRRRALQ